jgi:hypothetical protein
MLPFQIDSSFALHPLDVVLDEPGIYDFQIFGPSITGTIDSHLVFSVSIFATIFGNNTPDLRIPFAPFDSSDAYTAASGFLINDWFSIEVLAPPSDPPAGVVPEPASCVVWMALAAMGGAVIRRGPRRATEKKAAKS